VCTVTGQIRAACVLASVGCGNSVYISMLAYCNWALLAREAAAQLGEWRDVSSDDT